MNGCSDVRAKPGWLYAGYVDGAFRTGQVIRKNVGLEDARVVTCETVRSNALISEGPPTHACLGSRMSTVKLKWPFGGHFRFLIVSYGSQTRPQRCTIESSTNHECLFEVAIGASRRLNCIPNLLQVRIDVKAVLFRAQWLEAFTSTFRKSKVRE